MKLQSNHEQKTIKPSKNPAVNLVNLLAIELLEEFGIFAPKENQINTMESFISIVISEETLAIDKKLTQREQVCLYWAARGKSTKEIARILQVSTTTVETHRRNIIFKLNCKNITQAVFHGIRCGQLSQSIQ